MIKFPSFQQIISSSIQLAKDTISEQQLTEFENTLNSLPKKIKQLNADPYLFVFDLLINRKQTIDFALKQLQILIQQNYLTKKALNFIAQLLLKCLNTHSTQVVNIILRIKQPNLRIFQLFFQVYSTILLPQDVARRFRQVGYNWLIRVFQFRQYQIPKYVKTIYDKIGVNQIPFLISRQEQDKQLQTYVHKIINTVIYKIEDKLESSTQKKGKYLFCFMCGKAADYYCKDTKVPVCGATCKKDHLLYIENVNSINEKFDSQFKQSIQKMLMNNWFKRKSPSLSVDYLNSIFMFSQYVPVTQIQHTKICKSPIMMEKVWLFYSMYYQKKSQMFQHIFVNFLNCKNDYLEQLSRQYFVTISQTHRILQVYWNYDHIGFKRLFPIILNGIPKQYCCIIIQNTIDFIFNSGVKYPLTVPHPLSEYFIQHFNEDSQPLQQFKKYYPSNTNQIFCKFILRNQLEIDKAKLAEILQKNQDIMRAFLRQIVLVKAKAPLDQVLRQIFYFVNIKVSQKIYRLLELFYQIYQPVFPFQKNDVMFQFSYLIIMLVTEFHNPSLIQKPSLAQVLKRVSDLDPQLAKNNIEYIEELLQRVKQTPFNQYNRGQLKYYNTVSLFALDNNFSTPVIILQNYERIYDILVAIQASNPVIFKCCSLVIQFPQICSVFFSLLLERLQRGQIQDQYILQAIRNIVQQQPNAVGHKWQILLNYVKQSQKRQLQDQVTKKQQKKRRIFIENNIVWLDLMTLIVCSHHLTDDNLMYFFKDFSNIYLIDQNFQQYKKIMDINKKRLHLMANGIISSFRKIRNWFIAINLVQYIANLQVQSIDSDYQDKNLKQQKQKIKQKTTSILSLKQQVILIMLKQIPVTDTTQFLLVDLIITLSKTKSFQIKSDMWEQITHLTLKMKNQENQTVIEDVMKQFKNCQEYYQSLMIQKTLSNSNIQLISKQILQKLDKLQPYLNELPEQTLKLFILKSNYKTIVKNINNFLIYPQTFQLFTKVVSEEKQEEIENDMKLVVRMLIQKMINSNKTKTLLKQICVEQFNQFQFCLFQKLPEIGLQVFQVYSKYIINFLNPKIVEQKTSLDKATTIYLVGKQLFLMNISIKKVIGSPLTKQQIQILLNILKNQLVQSQKFNENYQFRRIIWKTYVMKSLKELPGLIKQISLIVMNILKILTFKQSKEQFNLQLELIIQKISQQYKTIHQKIRQFHQEQSKVKSKQKQNQESLSNLHNQKIVLKQQNKEIKLYNEVIVTVFLQNKLLYDNLQKKLLKKMQEYFLSLFYGGFLTNDLKHNNALSTDKIGQQIKQVYQQIIKKLSE